MANENRLIIGESGQAGWPISAPVGEYEGDNTVLGTIRWKQKNGCFVLQQFREWWDGKKVWGWVEVDCSIET